MGKGTTVSPAPRDAWSAVCASDPDTMPSQTPQWVDAMCDGSPWRDASRLYVTADGRRVVFPLVRRNGGPLASVASPRRGWGYGGIVADGGVTPQDIAIVSDDAAQWDALTLCVRPNPLHAHLWQTFVPEMHRVPGESYVVELDGGPEAVGSRFRRSALKGIKTAENSGVRVETATHGQLLPVFFDLTVRARTAWAERNHEPVWLAQTRGRIRDSPAKWTRIAKHLGGDFQVSIAWYEDRPAAACIVLHGRNAHGVRMATDPELSRVGASHLLNWVVLQNACQAGARRFHMGESATPGASEFKRFLGARCYEFDMIQRERIPFSRVGLVVRSVGKKAIGYRDAELPDVSGHEQPPFSQGA